LPHRLLLVSELPQRLLSRAEVRDVVVLPAAAWWKPEHLAENSPFVLTGAAAAAKGRVNGWLRIFIGIHSFPAQWRVGRWNHREPWVWMHLHAAFSGMAVERVSGSRVAVLEVSLPVRRAKADWPSIGPGPLNCLRSLAWCVDASRLPMLPLGAARCSSYIHLLKPLRGRPPAFIDRRLWRTELLEQSLADRERMDQGVDGAIFLEHYGAGQSADR
jgi:hypothetical protein